VDVSGLEDVRGGEILLLRSEGLVGRRGDAEVATFVLVKQPAEDRGRVEVWPLRELAGCAGAVREL
jgi:hypothetical protein